MDALLPTVLKLGCMYYFGMLFLVMDSSFFSFLNIIKIEFMNYMCSHIIDKYHYLIYIEQCNRGSPRKAQKGLLRAPAP